METTTPNLLTDYQTKRLVERAELMKRTFKILDGGRALGLEMIDLDVIGVGGRLWRSTDEENRAGLRVFAHQRNAVITEQKSYGKSHRMLPRGPVFTALRYDEKNTLVERLLLAVVDDLDDWSTRIEIADRTEAEALSPADTAIELRKEDVKYLEQVAQMYTPLQVPAEHCEEAGGGTLPLLEGILGEYFAPYGHGIERDGSLYVLADEVGNAKAIRPDGTILPIGTSLWDPDEDLDGEREETIRPRIEELRA